MFPGLHAAQKGLFQTSLTGLSKCTSILQRQLTAQVPVIAPMAQRSHSVCVKSVTPSGFLAMNMNSKPLSGSIIHPFSPSSNNALTFVRGYKSILRPRLWCDGCYFVWRHGRKYVECSDHPRHKQMKKLPTRNVWREDYTRGNMREVAKAMDLFRTEPRQTARNTDKISLSHNWLAGRLGKDL